MDTNKIIEILTTRHPNCTLGISSYTQEGIDVDGNRLDKRVIFEATLYGGVGYGSTPESALNDLYTILYEYNKL